MAKVKTDWAGFTIWAIIADGEFDQFCETAEQAKKEKADLEAMGCKVRVKAFNRPTLAEAWEAANAYEERLRD